MLRPILNFVGECWDDLRDFAFTYKTIFDVFFFMIYAAEQLFLIWVVTKMSLDGFRIDIISYFIVVVMLTFTLHKLVIESRSNIFEKKLNSIIMEFAVYKASSNAAIDELLEEKPLNTAKPKTDAGEGV